MPKCKNCGDSFPNFVEVKSKRIDCRKRTYCLKCNPFNERKFWGGKLTNSSMGISRHSSAKHMCPECGNKHKNKTRNLLCYACKNRIARNERKEKACLGKGNKCLICGYDRCIDALDFHHLDPSKKLFTLSSSWDLAWNRLEKELDKCVLLCCRCHCEVHKGMIKIP